MSGVKRNVWCVADLDAYNRLPSDTGMLRVNKDWIVEMEWDEPDAGGEPFITQNSINKHEYKTLSIPDDVWSV